MSRFGEAMKSPHFRSALFTACIPLFLGTAGGAGIGAFAQEGLTGGWEYGALVGGLTGGVLASVPALLVYVFIRNVGRHH